MSRVMIMGLAAASALAANAKLSDVPPGEPHPLPEEHEPPRRLTNVVGDPDYRPDFMRVGLRIDGEERNDVCFYDADRLEYSTINKTSHLAESIEPYWRYPETRQQRRARERWERAHGKVR
jgi:hypothetical protein